MKKLLNSSDGFTYLAALVIVVIMGIMLGAVGQSWHTLMKREREEELLFRGTQYRDAIARWNKPRPGQHVATPLREMKDLLKDPRSMANVRYLRRLYKDPLTGEDFVVVTDPVKGVVGVRSKSEEEPMKQGNFPDDKEHEYMKTFEGKKKYSEWMFVYGQVPQAGTVIKPKSPFLGG